MWFAETEFRLGKRTKDGSTLREHLESYERQSKRKHPDFPECCAIPDTLKYLWTYFWDLSAGRPVWQAGYRPIPAVEILAWEQINDIKLERWELGLIRQIDTIFLKVYAEE